MSVVKYIGRTNTFRGKTLWEIVGNLKNFGVGRLIVRSAFERYPEISYMKILKVEALPNEEIRKVKVTVERTFRGKKSSKPTVIESTSYKADYRLIPKHEESFYYNSKENTQEKILPNTMEFPPLLQQFLMEETNGKLPTLKLKIRKDNDSFYRIAKDGETPTVQL